MTFSKLGTDSDTQQIVELSQASRRQGLYIIGANGTGKTGLIEPLILQDIDQGLGVGLLDPHGDLVNAILAKMTKREADVILLDIQDEDHPFGLNIFECPNPQSPTAVQKIVDLVMHIFEKLYDVSRQTPRMAQFLRNCTHTLVANPGYTMADIPLLLQDAECRKKLVANVTDPQVQLFWKTYNALKPSEQFDRAESTINKMDELLQPLPRNIVGQGKTTVNIQQVMDERKILLVKLSAQLDQVTSLVGTLFIALFLNAAYSRASLPVNKRKQFNLYADEFQRFATEDFATLLTEARKFGIATTIAHQARYQPGMTDGIRAVSLQAANHVVFRVTSPDADELAGGFDITPQTAWEEEIEKEWVELLKSEWFERKEEEVEDGVEEIKTPVKDVVHHLLNGGLHKSDVVNQFAQGWLKTLDANSKAYPAYHLGLHIAYLNGLHYKAMTGWDITQFVVDKDFVQAAMDGGDYGFVLYPEDYWPNEISYRHPQLFEWQKPSSYEPARQTLQILWSYPQGSNEAQQAITILDAALRKYLRHKKMICLRRDIERGDGSSEYPQETWYRIDPTLIVWEEYWVHEYLSYKKRTPAEGQETKFYHEADLARAIEIELQQHRQRLLAGIHQLKQVMQALADDPIEVGSGLARPRKRKQINILTHPRETLTHPRKVIKHPQRTYQDVQKDIANQLSGFPNFTARVKLSEILSHNPGKKCLSCKVLNNVGAKFCSKCGKKLPAPNEYTFTTLKPLGGLGKAALQQRLTTIQANNLQKGYVQDRSKVEAEILNRQVGCSGGSALAQPQKAQQQTPHNRQVPTCPKCGKSNTLGSKFCNQCGTKL